MGHYRSNVRDLEFNLFEVCRAQHSGSVDEATIRGLLAELNKLATGVLAESFVYSDRHPPAFDPVTHTATVPQPLRRSFEALWSGDWHRISLPPELGGAGIPATVRWAAAELMLGANPALYLYFSTVANGAAILHRNGTPAQRRWAELMVERGWTATMVITEPDAGSDVGAARMTAEPCADGSWELSGVKRFITSGEHDLAANKLNNVVFLTGVWHWSVLEAGLAITPAPLLAATTARIGGRIADRKGALPVILIGCTFYIGGTLFLAWGAGQQPNFLTHWLAGTVCVGIGTGLAFPTFTGIGLAGYDVTTLGTGSAINAAARQVGGILGIAVLISLLASHGADALVGARSGWYFVVTLAACSAVTALWLPRGRTRS